MKIMKYILVQTL